jgi:hypothetical protein
MRSSKRAGPASAMCQFQEIQNTTTRWCSRGWIQRTDGKTSPCIASVSEASAGLFAAAADIAFAPAAHDE